MTVLYGWLKKYPQPTAVRADEQIIQVGKGARSWTELCNTVESLEATKVTCLDAAGNVLRSKTFEAAEPGPGVAADGDLQVFAKLLAEGYEKGSKSYAPLLDASMQFIERQGAQLAKAEAEIERLRLVNVKLRTELAEMSAVPASDDGGAIAALMAGIAQGQAEQPTPIGKAVKK
jgi:hypothetical protein